MWKEGLSTLGDVRDIFEVKEEVGGKNQHSRKVENLLDELKRSFATMMKDIESLAHVDYPKMLSLDVNFLLKQVFKFDHSYEEYVDAH